ncbi:GntR family transcriptional regulator [Salinisphaera orenii]|uniref:GntR family transcriptional regulator n=1 Tax=Salinisphaera orenii TaxID=856731 RepID=UPI0019550600
MTEHTTLDNEMELLPFPISEATITRQEWVYRQLKEAILRGRFLPGRSITLRGIAAMLKVSLTPVREALKRLVAERALEAHDNRRFSVPEMTRAKLDDICMARITLETIAVERALPYIDADCLYRLWRLNEQVDEAIAARDIDVYLARNREFHYTFYRIEQSSVFKPLIDSLWLQFSPYMRLAVQQTGVDYVVDRHAEALRAAQRHDARALKFAIEADVREGLGTLIEIDWQSLEM